MDNAKVTMASKVAISIVVAITLIVCASWVLGITFWLSVPGAALGLAIVVVSAAVPFAKDAQSEDPALLQALAAPGKLHIDWRPVLRRLTFWLILGAVVIFVFQLIGGADGRP